MAVGIKGDEVKDGGRTERALWEEVPAEQRSFLVEVLHWYHFRKPALRGSWRTEEALTWELIRALQLLPRLALLEPLLQKLARLGGDVQAAVSAFGGAQIEIVPYPSLGYVEERQNCRSDVGLCVSGGASIWLEAKTRAFLRPDLESQLEEQRRAIARMASGRPTAVVALLPVAFAEPFWPCLTWADVVSSLEEGLGVLRASLPDPKMRRGYETLTQELTGRIRSHPNRIAD